MYLTACDEGHRHSVVAHYKLVCHIDAALRKDSATLYVTDPVYDCVRLCATAQRVNEKFTFVGQTSGSAIAMLKFDNDSIPFYFVLEPGMTDIDIKADRWRVTGDSRHTKAYALSVRHIRAIEAERKATWQRYCKLAADTALHLADEQALAKRDSVLRDSLQRVIVASINKGDLASQIIELRFAAQLDSAHRRLLQH